MLMVYAEQIIITKCWPDWHWPIARDTYLISFDVAKPIAVSYRRAKAVTEIELKRGGPSKSKSNIFIDYNEEVKLLASFQVIKLLKF